MSYDQLTSNASVLATFKLSVIKRVSSAANVDPTLVHILRMYSGSVVLDVQVTSPANPEGFGGADPVALARVDTALTSITLSALTTFDSTFQAQFGITSITAVVMAVIVNPSSSGQSPAASSVAPIAAGAGGGGFLILVGVVVAVVVIRRRRKKVHPIIAYSSVTVVRVVTPRLEAVHVAHVE